MTDNHFKDALTSWVRDQIGKGNSNLYLQLEPIIQQTLLEEVSAHTSGVYQTAQILGISRPRMMRWENKNHGE